MRHSHAPTSGYARLYPVAGGLAFEATYDPLLVAQVKPLIPPEARRWDGDRKRWLVDARYGAICAELAETYLGVEIKVPAVAPAPTIETRLIKLEYLGRCKTRDNGESTAFGWADGGWTVIIPEAVLREWFAAVPQRPDEMPTLYAVLAVKPGAKFDEIKASYRRLVKQWRPDVCHEPDAATQFKLIRHAYGILHDDAKRKKYDAGLVLQASLNGRHRPGLGRPVDDPNGYRSPLRCGYVLTEGMATLGRFVVGKILGWEDIVDRYGRTMAVSWLMGAKELEVTWQ